MAGFGNTDIQELKDIVRIGQEQRSDSTNKVTVDRNDRSNRSGRNGDICRAS